MIKSEFDSFWDKTLKDLESTSMSEHVVEEPDLSARDYTTYKVILNSFENKRIRGIYSVPTTRSSKGIFPAVFPLDLYMIF